MLSVVYFSKMPKKSPKNAFYFFMVDFREEQRKKGVTYANMAEVSQAAGPLWTSAEPEVRSKFEAMAKEGKAKETKLTSTGISLAILEAMEREQREAAEAEQRDIIHFVKKKSVNESILDEDIFVMDVNSYCKARGMWRIGEFTLLRFTLREGIKDSYHELINPGIPYAFTLDMKMGSKEFCLPMPDECSRHTDYIQIFANVVDYLMKAKECPSDQKDRKLLPPVYTLPDKVAQCYDFLTLLCNRAGQTDTILRVYQLHSLFYQLVRQVSPPYRKDERFPKESLALTQLKRDSTFKYSPGLACEMHEEADRSLACTSNRAMSWAFTVLEMTCALLDLPPQPGRHLPADCTLDIVITKERRTDHSPCIPRSNDDQSPPTFRSDVVSTAATERNLSYNKSSSTNAEEKKRSHVPLRMPKEDLSYNKTSSTNAEEKKRSHVPLGMPKEDLSPNKLFSTNAEEKKRSHVPLRMPKEDLCYNKSSSTNAEEKKRSHVPLGMPKEDLSPNKSNAEEKVVPLRMPKEDDSNTVRAAPDLTASESRVFPMLHTRGRGRGLASILNRMKL